jgi:hypothetical protein
MIKKKPSTEELVDLNSKYSSMRWAFVLMVKLGAMLSTISIIGYFVAAFFGKSLPEAGIASIIGLIFTTAFGGKALQAGREPPYTEVEKEETEEKTNPDTI